MALAPQSTDDINAIIGGMNRASPNAGTDIRPSDTTTPTDTTPNFTVTRGITALPPQLRPNYQAPLPEQLQPGQLPISDEGIQRILGRPPQPNLGGFYDLPPNQPINLDPNITPTIPPGQNLTPQQLDPIYQEAASQYNTPGLTPDLLKRVNQVESGQRTYDQFGRLITSSAGAGGIAQFMPDTARRYGVNVRDPRSSIFGQAHYLSDLIRKHNGDVAAALQEYNGATGDPSMRYARSVMGGGGIGQPSLMGAVMRSFDEWGKPAPGMGSDVPGAMPTKRDEPTIWGRFAPALLGIASLAAGLPLSVAITAYGAMAKAQQNGQILDYQIASQRNQVALAEHQAQQQMEFDDASEAMSAYQNEPEQLARTMYQIGLKWNDPMLQHMAQNRDMKGIENLIAKRDALNQPLMKLQAEQLKIQQEQLKLQQEQAKTGQTTEENRIAQQEIASRDADSAKQFDAENPDATPEQKQAAAQRAHFANYNAVMDEIAGKRTGEKTATPEQQIDINAAKARAADAEADFKAKNPGQPVTQAQRDRWLGDALNQQRLAGKTAGAAGLKPQNVQYTDEQGVVRPTSAIWVAGDTPGQGTWIDTNTNQPVAGTNIIPVSRTTRPPLPDVPLPHIWDGAPDHAPRDVNGRLIDPNITDAVWQAAEGHALRGTEPATSRMNAFNEQVMHALPAVRDVLGIKVGDEPFRNIELAADKVAQEASKRYWIQGRGADQILRLNTVAGHLDLFRQYAAALQNNPAGAPTILNRLSNSLSSVFGYPPTNNFDTMQQYLSDEVVKLVTLGGSRGDREDAQLHATHGMAPEQMAGYADVLQNIVKSRFTAAERQYVQVPGTPESLKPQRAQEFRNLMEPLSLQYFASPQVPVTGGEPLPDVTRQQQPQQLQQQGQLPDWAKKSASGGPAGTIYLGNDNKWYHADHTPVP